MATVTRLPLSVDRVISATVKGLYSGRDLTADDVARALGISHGTMNARLRGRTSWTAAEVQALADFFHVTRDDLFTGLGGTFIPPDASTADGATRRNPYRRPFVGLRAPLRRIA